MDKRLVLVDTHVNPDIRRDYLAPDVSIYAADNTPEHDTTDFSKMELFIELKRAETSDPFQDPEDPLQPKINDFRFERNTHEAHLVRGQLSSYGAAHLGSQFRVHAFTVFICGKCARFIRWDRSGATVTRRFNHIDQPDILACFFWHYAHLGPLQRGYDTSVLPAPPADPLDDDSERRLRDKNPGHRQFRSIMVPDRDNPKAETTLSYHFLRGIPLAHPLHEPPDRCWRSIRRPETSFF